MTKYTVLVEGNTYPEGYYNELFDSSSDAKDRAQELNEAQTKSAMTYALHGITIPNYVVVQVEV